MIHIVPVHLQSNVSFWKNGIVCKQLICSIFLALKEYVSPCQPSPCGPNSKCREFNSQPACSCLPDYVGNPPLCRPECTQSSECAFDKSCVNMKCVDPCPGTCGTNANCRVHNHSPLCTCRSGYTGDPFYVCRPIPRKNIRYFNFHRRFY